MSRIKPIAIDQADTQTAATLKAVKAKLGVLPNLIATLAHAPAALNGYLAFSDAASKGRLSAAQREVIALAVAQTNQCAYCLAAHTAIGRQAGLSSEAIHAARSGSGQPAEQALARVASQLTEQRGWLKVDQRTAFHAAGFDEAVLIEVVALVALNTLTNYVNHVADTDVDFPRVDLELAA